MDFCGFLICEYKIAGVKPANYSWAFAEFAFSFSLLIHDKQNAKFKNSEILKKRYTY